GSAEAANNCTLTSTAPSTNWSDTTKWSSCGGTYPNNGDTANIGLGGGYTMHVDVPVNVVLSISTSSFSTSVDNTLQLQASSTPIVFTGGTGGMTMTNGLIFNNNGTVNLVSSTNPLAINNGTQFNNQSSATFSVQTSIPITTDNVAAPAINNSGSLNCTNGVN